MYDIGLSFSSQCENMNNYRKGENYDVLQLENRQTSRQSLWAVFWPNIYGACAETASSELPIKILK